MKNGEEEVLFLGGSLKFLFCFYFSFSGFFISIFFMSWGWDRI